MTLPLDSDFSQYQRRAPRKPTREELAEIERNIQAEWRKHQEQKARERKDREPQ